MLLCVHEQAESTTPDATLRAYFAACDMDVTESIITRLETLPDALLRKMDPEHVATAIKLYLKSLRIILQVNSSIYIFICTHIFM